MSLMLFKSVFICEDLCPILKMDWDTDKDGLTRIENKHCVACGDKNSFATSYLHLPPPVCIPNPLNFSVVICENLPA
jgi:hypothetical protein